ncbi:hypothetical protein FNF31_02360 [Cafeteria roenbergensis]|uniref:SH2 domain-containing protein n=1 Tax=Cafeteria roenbergensis TaxID=33653 RepID=A0A5A8DGA2_CAFRO|nr:hypothetical protein FNF31_02360 [Cafeteria roenbergensis]KAA0170088.1 hypothetical protein FNF28_01697 [Cafeteria roenbergensis]
MLRRRGVGVDRRTIPVSSPAGAAAAPWSTPTAAAAVAFLDGLGCTGSAATDAAGPEASTPSRGPAASAAPATVAARAAELAAAGMPLLLVGLGDAVVPPCLGGACPDAVVLDLRGVMDPQEGIAASMSGVRVGSVAQPAASEALTRACELTKSADVVGFVPPMGMWDAGQVECAMSTFFGFKASSLIALDALADYVASWTPVVGPGSPNSTEDMEALAEATGGSVLSLAGYRPREIQLAKSMSSNGIPRRVIIVSDDSYLQLTETLASGLKRDGHDTHIANKALRRLAQMEASQHIKALRHLAQMEASAAAASAGLPELSQYTAAAGGGDGGALSGAGGGARRRSDGWAGDADPASIDSYVRDAIAWAAGPAAHDGEAVPKPSEEPFVGGADAYATGLPDLDETSAAEPVEEERYGALVVVMTDESLRLHPPSPTMRLVVAARRVNLRIVPLKVRHPLVPPAIVAPLQYLDFSRVLLGRTVTQHQLFRERAKALSDTLRSRRPTAEGQWKLAQQLCQVTQSADDGAGGGAGGAMLSRRAWFHDEVAAWAASPTGAPVRIYDSEPGYGRSSIANDMRDTNPSVIAAHFASSANVQSRDLRLSILRLVFALSARIGDDHSSLLCPGGRARKVGVPGGRVMTLAEFVENAEPEDLAAELIPPLVRRIAEGSAEPSRKSLRRAGTSARLHPVMTPEHGRKSVADSPSERTAHFLRHAQTTMVKSSRHLAANPGVARQLPAHRHAITSSGVHTTAGLGPACTSADAGAGGSVDNDNDDDDDDDDDDEDDDSAASRQLILIDGIDLLELDGSPAPKRVARVLTRLGQLLASSGVALLAFGRRYVDWKQQLGQTGQSPAAAAGHSTATATATATAAGEGSGASFAAAAASAIAATGALPYVEVVGLCREDTAAKCKADVRVAVRTALRIDPGALRGDGTATPPAPRDRAGGRDSKAYFTPQAIRSSHAERLVDTRGGGGAGERGHSGGRVPRAALDGQPPPLAASGSVGSGPSSADFVDHVAELISRRSGPDFAMAFGLVAVARSGAIPRTITSESELPAQEEALQQALDLQMRDADSLCLRVPTAAALSVAAAAAEPLPANCVLSMALGQTFKANSKKLLRVLCRSFQVVGDRSLLRAWDQQWLQWAAGYSNGRSVDGHQRLARWAIENVERAVNKFNGDWSSGGASPAGAAPGAGAAGSAPSAGPALPSHTANPDVGEALIEALQSEPDCEYGLYHAQHHADICKGELLSRWTRLLSTHPALRFAVEVSRLRRAGHARVHHGPMSRPAAESRLRGPPPGAFLVRYSARANGDVVSFSNRPGSSANAFSHNVVYKLEDGTFATKSRPAATDLVYKDICALLGFYIANRTLSTPVLATQPARDAKP